MFGGLVALAEGPAPRARAPVRVEEPERCEVRDALDVVRFVNEWLELGVAEPVDSDDVARFAEDVAREWASMRPDEVVRRPGWTARVQRQGDPLGTGDQVVCETTWMESVSLCCEQGCQTTDTIQRFEVVARLLPR
jgi:hypothetical protein